MRWRGRERPRQPLASRRAVPGGQVGSVGAGARQASAVWFPLRLQAINKLPLGRMRAASKGGFPPNRAGGLRSGPELVLERPDPRVGLAPGELRGRPGVAE